MSVGLGVNLYGGPVPSPLPTFVDAMVNGVSNCLLFLADRDMTITHIFLSNMSGATARVRLAITLAGASTATNDSRKFANVSLAPGPASWTAAGAMVDVSTRIPLRNGWGLIGMSDVGLGDAIVYGAFSGEPLD